MEEELLRQILEELRSQETGPWLELTRLMVPAAGGLMGGVLAALVGFYAVRRSADVQKETVSTMSQTQRDAVENTLRSHELLERTGRRASWRREKYEELLAALSEWLGAMRMLTMAYGEWHTTVVQGQDAAIQGQSAQALSKAFEKFREIDKSSRVFAASVQIADHTTRELSQQIAVKLFEVTQGVVLTGVLIRAGVVTDPDKMEEAEDILRAGQDEALELCYRLNLRIEELISQTD